MAACAACGFDVEGSFKFCPDCGAPLGAAPARAALEERRFVTALFCDLVGFTAASESADPEDVRAMLSGYFAVARSAIERFGGTVEKFIGDAVVGVFGVPTAHEDDPERAVRAALAIAQDAERLSGVNGNPLRLRVGVNTGEALVRLDVVATSGEGMVTGDAINTASRIQSVAPVGGVAVGQATFDATRVVFDYEPLPPASLKGKSDPVAVFHARAPLARFGTDLTRTHDSPFVGREIDLTLLKGAFDKTIATASPQLVTVVGEPGLGKSRIVAELFGHVDSRPELVTWRQGRCLPYGDGITFWALGEVIKAHAGILDTDPAEVTIRKLDHVLPDTDERSWFRQRVLPLLGVEAGSPAPQSELFTAWRRLLEHIAENDPTVVVFEDLHWADEAMLAFIEHLADRADAVPLLIIGTARPELFERHPDYAHGLRNANTINLAPLSEAETASLISGLLDATMVPAELQTPILDRAGGNPLYAEEFVRLLKDDDLIVSTGGSWQLRPGAHVPFPDSVQALIAARLDTLTPESKSLLADAAVVGKVFWAGAIATMSGRDLDDVVETLRELARKELVRVSRHSSMAGETEYAFWHVLTRDVAYGQLPRPSRASRHVAAARWIESKPGTRAEDVADVLAYHYATAHTLTIAAGNTDLATELAGPALRYLTLAGERALGLDTTAALTSFQQALDLTPADHPDRPAALLRFGRAAYQAARYPEAADALEEAITRFRAEGDLVDAATSMNYLRAVLARLGDPRWQSLMAEAVALLTPLPPSPELVLALSYVAVDEYAHGLLDSAAQSAEQSVSLADELGIDPPVYALSTLGGVRAARGDRTGLTAYERAIDVAVAAGDGQAVGWLYNQYAMELWIYDGPDAGLDALDAGIAFATARGLVSYRDALVTTSLAVLLDAGQHDRALDAADDLATRFEASGSMAQLFDVRTVQTAVHTLRGQARRAADWLDWLRATSHDVHFDSASAGLVTCAAAFANLDDADAAEAVLTEIDAEDCALSFRPELVRTALAVGRPDLAEQVLAGGTGDVDIAMRGVPALPFLQHILVAGTAALDEHRGQLDTAAAGYAEAAARWEGLGVVPEHAHALLGQGRCLLALGRAAEARPALLHARTIFEHLHAAPALTQIDALLGEEGALDR